MVCVVSWLFLINSTCTILIALKAIFPNIVNHNSLASNKRGVRDGALKCVIYCFYIITIVVVSNYYILLLIWFYQTIILYSSIYIIEPLHYCA